VSPIRQFVQTPLRRVTHALIQRVANSLKERCAHTPIHRLADLPNHPITHSADRHFAYSLIHLSPKIRRSRSHPAVDDPRGRLPPPCPRARRLFAVLSRLWIGGKWTMSPQPARPGNKRPSGETAIGIPIAYPAISHQISLAIVPEAPMLLRVVRQGNSDHRP